jgi:hypothetical protein
LRPLENLLPQDQYFGWGLDADADHALGKSDDGNGDAQAGQGNFLLEASGKDQHGDLDSDGGLVRLDQGLLGPEKVEAVAAVQILAASEFTPDKEGWQEQL